MTFPDYQVVHGLYNPSSADFYMLLYQGIANAPWISPPNFAQTIVRLSLQASANLAQYQNAYVVGSGWASDAAAKAAAQADYAILLADRNASQAATALNQSFYNNPYITPYGDSPVSGPG